MYKYVRIYLIILIYILFISFVVNAEDIDKYTKNANIIYPTQKVEDTTQNEQLPENVQKWDKSQLYNYLIKHFYWSSWTHLNVGDYYSIFTFPLTYLDDKLVHNIYPKSAPIFNGIIKSEDLITILNNEMTFYLDKILNKDTYYVSFNDKNELICFSVN